MPFVWTAERERQMLLLAICEANFKPTTDVWASIATKIDGGLTPSAVSQKFHKLRNEHKNLKSPAPSSSARSTPGTSTGQRSPQGRRAKKKQLRASVGAKLEECKDAEVDSSSGDNLEDSTRVLWPVKEEGQGKHESVQLNVENGIYDEY